MKPTIVCLGAKAVDTTQSIQCLYYVDDVRVFVSWNNRKHGMGIADFYLTDIVVCDNPDIRERVVNAIRAGESDDNIDLDIYLALKDGYGLVLCEYLSFEVFSKGLDKQIMELKKAGKL